MKPRRQDRLFPLILLCTVVFGCLVISEGKADIQGIPGNDNFSRASYPYARVLQSCTSWRKPDHVSDKWGAVSFRAACQQHDKCFHTVGTTWSDCNRRFMVDLRDACDRDLRHELLDAGGKGEPDAEKVRLCYEIANFFHAKVQDSAVRERFEFAQGVQKEYLGHVESSLSSLYQRLVGREPSESEIAYAFESLDSGMSFADIERSVTSGEGNTSDLPLQEKQASLESESGPIPIQTVSGDWTSP